MRRATLSRCQLKGETMTQKKLTKRQKAVIESRERRAEALDRCSTEVAAIQQAPDTGTVVAIVKGLDQGDRNALSQVMQRRIDTVVDATIAAQDRQ